MNYDKIILELLDRIKNLEEKVEILEADRGINYVNSKENLTQKARDFIIAAKAEAMEKGSKEIILLCNDIQKALGITNRPRSICCAMYDCMRDGDEVLYAPQSGYSTTVKIKYYLK